MIAGLAASAFDDPRYSCVARRSDGRQSRSERAAVSLCGVVVSEWVRKFGILISNLENHVEVWRSLRPLRGFAEMLLASSMCSHSPDSDSEILPCAGPLLLRDWRSYRLAATGLAGIDLAKARLVGAKITNTRLVDAESVYARLADIDLTAVGLRGTELAGIKRAYAGSLKLGETDLEGCTVGRWCSLCLSRLR